jgi:phenylacetate-CoA ligase
MDMTTGRDWEADIARRSRRPRLAAALQRRVSKAVVGIGLRDRLALLEQRKALHASITEPDRMARWQVDAFNQVWRGATTRYRFYADWRRRHGLPEQLGDLAALRDFPVLRKADIEASLESIAQDAAPCRFAGTGGSSGPSCWFPRSDGDDRLLHSSMYLGRSWAGIRPGDDIVLIWGHEHLYGFGAKGHVVKAKRRAMDWLIGTRRLNVYHLDDNSVAAYFDAICSRPGAVVVGYVSAIRKLLQYVESSGIDGRKARVRGVIFCSETVFPKDIERVRTILGSTPLIEYGMGETGVMAYSRPDNTALTFFWDAIRCHVAAGDELIVTTLQPRHFPLINYGTGDRVEPLDGPATLPFRCARIIGRTRDVLALRLCDERIVETHSELLEDCLDLVSEVRSYFIHQKGEAIDIAVRVEPRAELDAVRRRFLQVVSGQLPGIDEATLTFSRLEREPRTIAGKRQYILRE